MINPFHVTLTGSGLPVEYAVLVYLLSCSREGALYS
jgi:hypothetical protein